MYTPKSFEIKDRAVIKELIEENGFGLLVSPGDPPEATHLPFLYAEGEGANGTLYTHLARNNPQWQALRTDQKVLAVFTGVHGYISPSWYEAKLSVPTWDYTAVHFHGLPELVEEPGEFRGLLERLVAFYEKHNGTSWSIDLPEDYLIKMMGAIVGVRIRITEVQAQFKLSQNRSVEEKKKVAAALRGKGPDYEALAELIEKYGDVKKD